jgi:hypothetical protein
VTVRTICGGPAVKLSPFTDTDGGAPGTRYEYNLKIDRSQDSRRVPITYRAAPSCSPGGTTDLVTDFVIAAAGVAVQMQTEQTWGCSGDGGVSQLGAPA